MEADLAHELETTAVLGRHEHYVYAGGAKGADLLLLCHGGPGYSELPMIRAGTYSRLQGDLLLVTWDQRGTARSYSEGLAPETMTVGQLVEDATEVVAWVRQTFDVDKVHLLGHSWGGCLALLLAARQPETFASVYALCPFIDLQRSAAIAYALMVAEARRRGDDVALTELGELGAPPYADPKSALEVHTKWIVASGGMVRGGPERVAELFGRFEDVPGYSADDYERATRGQLFSGEHLIDECATLDLAARVPALAVPVSVGVGRHDLVNATSVTTSWFETVSAPSKRLHVFEHSAHFPNFCEPEAFQASVAQHIADSIVRSE